MKKKIFLTWGKGIDVKKSKKRTKVSLDVSGTLAPDIWNVKLEKECVQKQESLARLSERSIFNF